jgi:ceramide glucosyltransferase
MMKGWTGDLVLSIVAAWAVIVTLFTGFAVFFVTRRRKNLPDYTPPVTILKPLKGVDEGLEANLRSFFDLDYPKFQLLFGVADNDDPAIPVVEQLIAEYPDHDAKLIVGTPPFGLNPKVENLGAMYPHRRHDVILISDSNVLVKPSYLRETACYLAKPNVGLVSNLFNGKGEEHFGAALENLHLNGFIAGGVAAAAMMGITCVVGKSMLMPVQALEAAGGLLGVRNLLAEDQVLGLRIRKAGYSVVLSHHVIDNINQDRSSRWFLNRHSRWFKIRRQLAFPMYIIEPTANLATVGVIWALVGASNYGWFALFGLIALGMLRDAVQAKRLRGSYPTFRFLVLSPVKDLFLMPIWFDALIDRRVHWRGNTFSIGKFTRLHRVGISRQVRKRVRRARRLRSRLNRGGETS